ncbi:MAG TPA: hypothetical protein DCX06_00975 [Opitutae bacterium]|nr:hypothetical protein [Opitutae bacterium]
MTTNELNLKDANPLLQFLALLRDHELEISGMVAASYESVVRRWDRTVARFALDQMLEDASARIPKGGRVLDAGCGTGLRIPEIRSVFQPQSITGIDTSIAMLDRARENISNAFFTDGDILCLPFESETFDAVVATWVMETLADPRRAVEECLRVLKSGGILAYSFVNLPGHFKPGDHFHPSALHVVDEATREQELLGANRIDFGDSEFALIKRHQKGLITTVILGKCCNVEPYMLPLTKL